MTVTVLLEQMLSTRACNVLERALNGTPFVGASVGFVREALLLEARERGRTPRQQLLVQKDCGAKTATEILTRLGLDTEERPHVCVCRQCGRRLGGRG